MSLFIGGLHDGEWHHVERLPNNAMPKQWSMSKRASAEYLPNYFMKAPVETWTRSDHYELLEFHVDGHHYRVYRLQADAV